MSDEVWAILFLTIIGLGVLGWLLRGPVEGWEIKQQLKKEERERAATEKKEHQRRLMSG